MKLSRYGQGIAKGMALTFKYFFTKPITTQYPEEKLQTSKRIRGNELVWVPYKCTGCATCAKYCLQGNIEIVTNGQTPDGRYAVEKFEVDIARCIMCGLCVESCPFDALYMGMSYELAAYQRGDLVLSKEKNTIGEDKQPSAYFRPNLEKVRPAQTLLIERPKYGL
ncbi:MAG: NADH-quinone oxidoreductase subunit I [Chloroflexi bacterium]|nr:NADH-quinone oxidoreductase subunit I [Chloroflexota bacterium]